MTSSWDERRGANVRPHKARSQLHAASLWRTGVVLLLLTAQGVALGQESAPPSPPADRKPVATTEPTEAPDSAGVQDAKAPVRSAEPLPRIPATLTQGQIKALINEVAEKDIENDKYQRDYTYVQREEEHKLDDKGIVKSTESRTSEVRPAGDSARTV